jgi:hypothetical protein
MKLLSKIRAKKIPFQVKRKGKELWTLFEDD